MGIIVPVAHQEFHDQHALDLGRGKVGEEGAPFIVVDGQMKNTPPQRFHRRLGALAFRRRQISADILAEQGAQIAQQGVELDSQHKLAITGLEIELERLPCVQDRSP